MGSLDQSSGEVDVALSRTAALPLASALVVARGDACPRCDLAIGGKDRHVYTQLGDDDGRQSALDARNLLQQLNLFLVRLQSLADLCVQLGDIGIELIDSSQLHIEHLAMMVANLPVEGQLELRKLLPEYSLSQLAELTWVDITLDDLADHQRSGDAEDVTGDDRELDVRRLEDLDEAIAFGASSIYQGSAIAGQVSELSNRLRRNKALSDQPMA